MAGCWCERGGSELIVMKYFPIIFLLLVTMGCKDKT
jgi:hypothetical protein